MIKNKKIIALILTITMLLGGTSAVSAYYIPVNYSSFINNVQPPKNEEPPTITGFDGLVDSSSDVYTCYYDSTIISPRDIYINTYNLENKNITENDLNIEEEDRVLAGTHVGINLFESKYIYWKVNEAYVTRTYTTYVEQCTYECRYQKIENKKPAPKPGDPSYGPIIKSNYSGGNNVTELALPITYTAESDGKTCPAAKTGYIKIAGPYVKECIDVPNGTSSETLDGNTVKEKEIIKRCKEEVIKKTINSANNLFYATYEIVLNDSNDVDSRDKIELSSTQKNCYDANNRKITTCKFDNNFTDGNNKYIKNLIMSDSRTVEYEYLKKKACMNVLTAQVRYIDLGSNDTCDSNTEVEISNETITENGKRFTHWHYFVPLNAKSNDTIEINLLSKDNAKGTATECLGMMKNHKPTIDKNGNIDKSKTSYINLIVRSDGKNFVGDYWKYEKYEDIKVSEDVNEIYQNGCILTSNVNLPINQKFYNEVTDKNGNITFNGFNFYYKPIDINNAFPNGLLSNSVSLWTDWYNADDKTPDLTESYNQTTYRADINNTKVIREYNNENPYTSWSNMNKDGSSNFIDNTELGVINRSEYDAYYKLGCGPKNEQEYLDDKKTKKNPLYIEGCEKE